MKFLHTFIGSLNRKGFYKRIIEGKEGIGFGYLFKLEIIAALFIVTIISINISSVLPTLDEQAGKILPEGAEIIIKNGALKTNVNPVTIPMPAGVVGEAKHIDNFLVLDITANLDKDDLVKENALILINSEGIISRPDGRNIDTVKFSEIPGLNLTLDQEWFIAKATWLKSAAKFVPFLLFAPLVVSFYILALFWSLIYGLLAYWILRMHKRKVPFKVAFAIGLYSRTFALVVTLFMLIVPVLNIAVLSIPLNIFFIYAMLRQTLPSHSASK